MCYLAAARLACCETDTLTEYDAPLEDLQKEIFESFQTFTRGAGPRTDIAVACPLSRRSLERYSLCLIPIEHMSASTEPRLCASPRG